jgi:hypothetical protein
VTRENRLAIITKIGQIMMFAECKGCEQGAESI